MKNKKYLLDRKDFSALLEALTKRGYRTIGPTRRDMAIMYDEIDSIDDLPAGWTDDQDHGTYRLYERDDQALFGYVIGPDSWKKYLHPPQQELFTCTKEDGVLHIHDPEVNEHPLAFIGMRACELHAIAIQDAVFLDPKFTDPGYARRRASAFFVAVNCTQAAKTCFCVSTKSGPRVDLPVDLNLTELVDDLRHVFLIEVGSEAGAEIIDDLPTHAASTVDEHEAEELIEEAATQMGRTLDTNGLTELLYNNLDHPRWEEVAERCLGCSNCTMVCPTCFCTTVEDVTDIAGTTATRTRRWDSCFTLDFTYMHGTIDRRSGKSRYRQWMTHKLASWQDQFSSLGCTGCGRCISWCPVGIDITEEVNAIRTTQPSEAAHGDS
jgi:ferredoxin